MRSGTHRALATILHIVSCSDGANARLVVPEPEILRPPAPRPIDVPEVGDELFDPEQILDVDLFIAEADWDRLRLQNPDPELFNRPDCQARPYAQFTFYPGTVAIDRNIIERIEVRKRGFRFELNDDLPSLEIRFPSPFEEHSHIFLDSVVADPSLMRTCLAHRLFTKAGLAAPRCTFAHVRVNGADRGIYVNVEPVDATFAERVFGVSGDLFEGKASDFRDGWMATFEGDGDRAPIRALRDALTSTDEQLIERVSAVVDLDWFHRFWALETLLGHWDGYAGNADRFFIFAHPERGLLFIPSAPETSFSTYSTLRVEQPASVYAQGELARRLYLTPSGRARHLEAMGDALNEVWDEADLALEIERIEALIRDRLPPWRSELGLAELRGFIARRRAAIEAELPAGVDWVAPKRPSHCMVVRGGIDAAIATTWDTLPLPGSPIERIFTTGTATIATTFDDVDYRQGPLNGAGAGTTENGYALLFALVQTDAPAGGLVLYVGMDPSLLVPGTREIDNMTTFAQAVWYVNDLPEWIGYAYGTIEVVQASTIPGAPIQIHLFGDLY